MKNFTKFFSSNDETSNSNAKGVNPNHSNQNGMLLANYKRSISKLQNENKMLRSNLPRKININISKEGFISTTETLNSDGKVFRHESQYYIGAHMAGLYNVLMPIINLTRQLATNKDVNYLTPIREIDSNGKTTKEPKRDVDGNKLYYPNNIVRLEIIANAIDQAPDEVKDAIKILSDFLESIDVSEPVTTKRK